MAGAIKRMIDTIIAVRSEGNPTVAQTTRSRLMIKGINPDHFTSTSPDDPAVVDKLYRIAAELNVKL